MKAIRAYFEEMRAQGASDKMINAAINYGEFELVDPWRLTGLSVNSRLESEIEMMTDYWIKTIKIEEWEAGELDVTIECRKRGYEYIDGDDDE